jgi:rhodanese-related sulfurtransferase
MKSLLLSLLITLGLVTPAKAEENYQKDKKPDEVTKSNLNCDTIKDYDRDTAHTLIKQEKGLLLDVRTLIEYKISNIKNSKRIHVGDLEEEIDKVKTWVDNDMNRPIVVFCAAGVRAARAKKILKSKGFKCVQNLGGISDW